MSHALLCSACWPNLHYAYYLVNCEQATIECHDTYSRQSYRNRYEILSSNGVLTLSVPVMRGRHNQTMNEVRISYHENWQIRHWRGLTSAYGKSAFFEFFEDDVRSFYFKRFDLLLEYNMQQLVLLKKIFSLATIITQSTTYVKHADGMTDLRSLAAPGNASGEPSTLAVIAQPYFQTFSAKSGFVKNLSVLDLLFNTGLNAKDYLRGKYI